MRVNIFITNSLYIDCGALSLISGIFQGRNYFAKPKNKIATNEHDDDTNRDPNGRIALLALRAGCGFIDPDVDANLPHRSHFTF